MTRRMVLLTDAGVDALLSALGSARAGGSGGDHTDATLRMLEKIEPLLVEAPLVDVVITVTGAQADELSAACNLLDNELENWLAQDDPPPDAARRRAVLARAWHAVNAARRAAWERSFRQP